MIKFFAFVLLVFAGISLNAQTDLSKLRDHISKEVARIEPKCIEWRRDIHQHPELGNHETRTSQIVIAHLKSLGIEVKEGVAKTGVVGILRGAKPGPCIALRADMDGLPITEKGNLPFASKETSTYNGQSVGVMHACGHDSHVAMLMSVAEILAGIKNQLKGTVKFIFQPSEEGPPEGEEGGAPLMVKEGAMDDPKVDVIFGLHIESQVEVGRIEYKSAAFMASSDWFAITVKGKGSHGAQPWLGIDPIVISAQIIQGFQTIVSRQSDLTNAPVVITVGKISGGVRSNIIPDECTMNGTIRTFDESMRQAVIGKIEKMTHDIAEASGATATVKVERKTLVTYNNPDLVKKMIPSLQTAIGASNVVERNWVTGSEDFSFFGTKAPAFFFYLGGMPKGMDPAKAPAHHTPEFYIDEAGFSTGIKAFCNLVIDYMNTKP